jgi:hypothetical protein
MVVSHWDLCMSKQSVPQKPPSNPNDVQPLEDSVLNQIDAMNSTELSEVLRAVARRINPLSSGSHRQTVD